LSQSSEYSKRAVLPFALIAGTGGASEFPLEMTYATILADVEKKRAKAGLVKRREEVVAFVSMLHWPIILIPWRENRFLVFDGMAVWSHVFEDPKIANTQSFLRAIEGCAGYKQFASVEDAHVAYFKEFAEVERLPIMGLFIHEEFMKDLLDHFGFARPAESAQSSFLEPRMPTNDATMAVKRIADMIIFGKKELEGLAVAKESLRSTLERFRREIEGLVEEVRRRFTSKIEAIRPDVTDKASQLERKREEMWSLMQPRLVSLQAEVRKLESEESHWVRESKRKELGQEAQTKARERLNNARRDLENAKGEVQKYQDEMARMRSDYDKQVQAQWERIRSLERERDAQVAALMNDQQTMTQKASMMFQDMENLRKKKEEQIAFVEAQGVMVPPQLTSDVIYMPLFVSSLVGDKGVRYAVYPPMIAKSGKGVIGGIQSMFGGLVLPLEPKTKQFDEVFRTGIEKALVEDRSLATYIGSVSMSANVLHRRDLPDMLVRGFAELKSHGWIKDKHEKELLRSLQRHITMASSTAPPK